MLFVFVSCVLVHIRVKRSRIRLSCCKNLKKLHMDPKCAKLHEKMQNPSKPMPLGPYFNPILALARESEPNVIAGMGHSFLFSETLVEMSVIHIILSYKKQCWISVAFHVSFRSLSSSTSYFFLFQGHRLRWCFSANG